MHPTAPVSIDARRAVLWLRLFSALMAIALVAAVVAVGRSAMHGDELPGEVTHAELAAGAPGTEAAWHPIALPDTWARHRGEAGSLARYRATLVLAAPPEGVWALRIDRLSSHADVRVNGTLVHGTLHAPSTVLRRPVPVLVALPEGLMRAGENRIEIDCDHGARGGLSALRLGPMAQLQPGFIAGYHREVSWPQWLNVVSAGACLVGLMIWWRRRSEAALGSFAALGLLASLRNVGYYAVSLPMPHAVSDWLFFAAQVASVMLVGLFAQAVSGRRVPRWRAAWLGGAAVMVAIGSVAAAGGWLQTARAWLYPLLLIAGLSALRLVWHTLVALPTRALALVLAGLGLVFAAGVHDYVYQQGLTSVMDAYSMPYAVPIAVLAFTAMLVRRVVDALHGVEQANAALEGRVRERTAELERANAAKGRFLAAASHDLRQPVASIGLLVGLLREQAGAPDVRRLADRIDQGVAALESLLRGLLDLSRLDAGTVQPRLGRVPLQSVFDAIAAHEAAAAQAKGLRLRFRPTALAVVSDAVLLEQMLRNLVNNAVRCTARGGVLVAARARGGEVLLQVFDTGIGMSAEQQAAAFEEFVQFDKVGADGRVRGLGLGLAIVQRSARLLRHPLTLRSVPGRGSCFALTLPAERRQVAREAAEPPAPGTPLAGARIAVVEDEHAVRVALQWRLERWGAEVHAYEALQPLRDEAARGVLPAVDLLLTDLRLPDGDGLAAIALLRAAQPALPALVVSGTTLPAELARLKLAGVPVLNKPFRTEALLQSLREALPGAAAQPA